MKYKGLNSQAVKLAQPPNYRFNHRHLINAFVSYLILFFTFAGTVFAQNPALITPDVSVKVGQTFEIRIDNVPYDTEVAWSWDPVLNCRKTDNLTLSCSVPTLRGKDSLEGVVKARIPSLQWQDSATITVDGEGGRRTKGEKPGKSDIPPQASAKSRKIENLFSQFKLGGLDEMGFFNAMGEGGVKISLKDLVEFKGDIINRKTKELGDYKAALQYWNDNYRGMEQKLMSVRKDTVLKIWNATVERYMSEHPDSPPIARMDVGGWVSEPLEKMRFEGDIDFTVVMLSVEDAIAIRKIFEAETQKIFNLDMVAVDALATAHRAATISVYIGDYGADWAEIDAIRRGKIHIVQRNEDGSVSSREANETEKAVMFAVLKNNIAMSRGEPDRLADILKEKKVPEPKYDMEPGISLEFLRHITGDAIHADLALHEKILKMSKYLDRSAKEHEKILKAAGATPQPIDTDIVKFAGMITELKQMKGINPEIALWLVMKRTGDLAGNPDWVLNPETALKAIAKRMTDVITHNIEEGIDARMKVAESKKTLAEQDAEKKKLLDDLENEYKAFRDGEESVPFPKKAHEVMMKLADYFKRKAFKLPVAEQKRLKELLEKASENPEMTKITFAIVQEAAARAYANAVEAMGAVNNFLDTLDNKTIESLRTTGVIEFERTVVEGGKEEVKKTTIIKIESIARINQSLNESVLGKIGQSTAFQAFNLVSEAKSYYDAVSKAGSWSESFTNLSVEIFRRRTPVGGAVEAFVHGNYLRTGIEVVYTIFPPLAIPEGLYGMIQGAAEWGVGKMQEWRYEDMVNELYRGAKFEKAGNAWKIASITYKCPSGDEMTIKGRDEIIKLPMRCSGVFQIIIPQIKNHPVLLQYQEMLDNSAVSSGRMGNFPFNWDVRGGKYGEQLLKTYRKKVNDVAIEYFKGVVEQLEKAQAWASGKKLGEVMEIEKELGCKESLITFNIGYFGGDRYLDDVEKLQKMVTNFNQLKQSNDSILKIKGEWNANDPRTEVKKGLNKDKREWVDYTWVKGLFPDCSKESIEQKSQDAKKLDSKIKDAVKKCQAEAAKIVGSKKLAENKKLIEPLVQPAICIAVYEDTNSLITEGCKKDYEKALADLKGQGVDIQIKGISGPDTLCVGSAATYKVEYDRACDSCVSTWSLTETGERLTSSQKNQVIWTPKYTGKNTLRVTAKGDKDAKKEAVKDKEVIVLSEEKCPKIRLQFRVKTVPVQDNAITVQQNDLVEITAVPEKSLPQGQQLTEYGWTEDGQRNMKQTGSSYQFVGKGKKGKKVILGVKARTTVGYTEESRLTINVSDSDKDDLTVFILPKEIKTIVGQDPIPLSVDFIKKVNSGRMKIQWTVSVNNAAPWINSDNLTTIQLEPKNYKDGDKVYVTVLVQDIDNTYGSPTYGQILRDGNDKRTLTVGPSGDLTVRLSPLPDEISEAEGISVCADEPALKPFDPVNKYKYAWKFAIDGRYSDHVVQTTQCVKKASVAGLVGKTVRMRVEVRDDIGRTAEAETKDVRIVDADTSPKLQVSVTPSNADITNEQSITFVINVTPVKDSGQLTINGVKMPKGTTSVSIPATFKDNENWVTVQFEVTDEKGRKAETFATVYVTKKKEDKKPDDKKTDDKKPDDIKDPGIKPDGKDGKKDDSKKEPPVCSYKYSDWSECVRATKKQTRSVTAMEPPGCVEKGKPALEQGCTPPPTEEDKRNSYFNCLCRCYCGWAGHIGVWYDPEEKTKPECKSSGPCIGGIGAWGCSSRHFFGAPNDCAKGCYEGVYGKGTYDKDKADKIRKDENKKFKKPLKVTIKASKNPADFGEIVNLTAEATEGTGGYKFTWGGCAQDAKEATAKVANTRACTSCAATVSVTDQDGDSASDSVTIQCTALTVKLKLESPKENTVPVGGKATFFAEVLSGDKPASGTFFYVWEQNPDAIFGDPKNPQYETSGGASYRHTATFRKPGVTPVWVNVLKEIEGKKTTMGESEQIPITVKNPRWKMEFAPPEPLIAQEVKATLSIEDQNSFSKDDMKDLNFEWRFPDNARQSGPDQRDGVATFYLKDTKAANIQCIVRKDGDNLGGAGKTITAKAYAVTLSQPRYLATKPKIWKCDTQLGGACPGLVDAGDQQFAVHHDIFIKATVSPLPESPRYRWSIDPSGSCGLPGAGAEIKLNCSSTGSYTVKIEVNNADGIKLGEATQSVTISISQEQLSGANKSKDAHDKLQKAKDLVAQGKLDEGIPLADEASKLDPKNSEASGLAAKWKKEKQEVMQNIEKTKKLITEVKFEDAEKELAKAKRLHLKYQPVIDAEKLLNDKKAEYEKTVKASKDKFEKAKVLVAQGKLDEGIPLAEEALKLDLKNIEAKNHSEKWKKERDEIKQHIMKLDQFLKDKKIADAEKELTAAQKLHPKYQPVIDAQKRLKDAKDEYKKSVMDKLNQARSLAQQGKLDEAISLAEQAAKLDSKAAEPVLREIAQASKKAGNDALYNRDFKIAVKRFEDAVRLNSADLDAKNLLARAKRFEGIWPQVEQKAKEFDQLITEKKVFSAHKKMLEMQQLQFEMPGGMANQLSKKAMDSFNKALQEYNEFRKDVYGKWTGYFQAKEWAQAIPLLEGSLKRELSPADEKQDASSLQMARQLYADQQQVWDFYQKAKAEHEQGKTSDPSKTAQDLRNKTSLYGQNAPQRQQMLDLANAIEKKSAENQQKIATGKKLRAEGEALQQQNKLVDAVAKYKESLKYLPDKALEDHIKKIEDQIAQNNKKKELAENLWKEGTNLYNQKQLTEALSKFKESLTYYSKPEWSGFVQKLEAAKVTAKNLRDEGASLQSQGNLAGAVNKYKQSIAAWPNPELEKHIKLTEEEARKQQEMNVRKLKAEDLWKEGTNLYNQKQLTEALSKFKESLTYYSKPEWSGFVQKLEAAKVTAKNLRDEGASLQSQGNLAGAVNKYKQSIAAWPNPELEKHIAVVEAEIRKQQTASQVQTPTSPPIQTPVPTSQVNLTGLWTARCNDNKVTYSIRITHNGSSFEAEALKENERYRGTVSGTTIAGKSFDGRDALTGEIISNNELRITLSGMIGSTSFTNRCVLTRGGDTVSTTPQQQTKTDSVVIAEFTNNARENIHIIAEGQDSFGPQNRVAPGEMKKVSVTGPSQGGFIKFIAGRGGQKLAECRWEYAPGSPGRIPVVKFYEPNGLSCSTGLR